MKISEIITEHYQPLYEGEQLNEGLATKIGSMALGLVMALGMGKAMAEQWYVYHDAATNTLQLAPNINSIPKDALMSFKVDTNSKSVDMIRGGKVTHVQVDPATVKQTIQQQQQVQQQSYQQTQQQPQVQRVDDSVLVYGATLDSVKDNIMDKMMKKDRDWTFDESGRILVAKMNSVQGKNLMLGLQQSMFGYGGSRGETNLIVKYHFSQSQDGAIKITPRVSFEFTNPMGGSRQEATGSADVLASLERLYK